MYINTLTPRYYRLSDIKLNYCNTMKLLLMVAYLLPTLLLKQSNLPISLFFLITLVKAFITII